MKYITTFFIFLATVLLSAQTYIPCEEPQNLTDQGQQETKDQRKSRREQIQNAKIAFYTSEIQLTPEEAQAFWPVYNAYWAEINKAHRQTREYLSQLAEMDKAGKSDMATISKVLDQYVASYENEGDIYQKYYTKFLAVLSPQKVAKLYLAEERFRERMIEMIKEQPKNE